MERQRGAIVNIVHIYVSERGAPMFGHSGAARAGVVNLTRGLAPYLEARRNQVVRRGRPDAAHRPDDHGVGPTTDSTSAEGCCGSWKTSWSAARSRVAVASGSPVPVLRA